MSNSSTLTRGAGTSMPTAKAIWRRPSVSHLLIALAVVLAFVFNFLALQDRNATELVAIASAPITAGSPLSTTDIRWVSVDAGFEGISGLIMEADAGEVAGMIVGRSLPAGAVIDRSSLLPPGSAEGLRTMSVPIAVEHAAGSSLNIGDRVDVISVVDDVPVFIAIDLEVVGLPDLDRGALSGVGSYHLLLAVSASDALALAGAIADGSMEIVRSTGAAPIESASE